MLTQNNPIFLEIFNVGHGACALFTCHDGTRIMIDAGHNADTGWYPGNLLRSRGVSNLQRLYITNYDEDHVSGLPNLFDNIFIEEIIRNTSVTPSDVRHLKSEDGMGAGIDRLIWECERNFGPPGVGVSANTNVNGLTAEVFYHNYPVDFDDENNLSLVTIFNCYGIKVIFPGDMEMSGWRKLLTRPHFCSALRSLDIFIAPHHGRISGCCDEVFPWIGQPTFVVISDKAKGYQSQETTTYYAERTRGGIFRHTNRKVLTTRSDGSMIFRFNENGIYTAD